MSDDYWANVPPCDLCGCVDCPDCFASLAAGHEAETGSVAKPAGPSPKATPKAAPNPGPPASAPSTDAGRAVT